MDIKEALLKLDVNDDEQWTADGAPKVDVVKVMVGQNINRQDIIDAAPDFNRETAAEPDSLLMNQKDDEDETPPPDLNDEDETPPPDLDDEDEAEQENFASEEDRSDALHGVLSVATGEPKDFVKALEEVATDDLEKLADELRGALKEGFKAQEDMKKAIARLNGNIGYVLQRLKKEKPDMTNQQAIQAFIAGQNKARAEKMEGRMSVLKSLKASDLDPRAPIDQAMARKTKRGGQRPQHPRV